MYRVRLTDAEQQELQRRAHQPAVKARTRDRLEMVRLSHAGWSAPQIARHLGVCEKRVRHWLKTFLHAGFDALPDRPHPGQQSALTPAKEEAIRERLRQEPRTWTAGQLAEWVAEHLKVRLSADRLARRLNQEGGRDAGGGRGGARAAAGAGRLDRQRAADPVHLKKRGPPAGLPGGLAAGAAVGDLVG